MKKVSTPKKAGQVVNKSPSLPKSAIEPIKPRVRYKEYLQAVIGSLGDELIVIDRDYRIIQANEVALSRHDRKGRGIIGEYCYEISHDQHEPCNSSDHKCPLEAVWKTGKPSRTTHCHIYHVGGKESKRYLDIIASPVKDSKGNVIAVSELMRDVTAAKEMESKNLEIYRNLSALISIAAAVNQSLDLDTVLSSAIDKTLEIMKRNTGGILLWNEEKQMLCYRVYHGLSNEYAQAVCFRPSEGIVGRVAQSGKAILADDISLDSRVAHPGLVATEGLRAFAAVPLKVKDKVLGVLTVASHDARKFTTEDAQLLESIASQIAIAVENAKLHQEVQYKDESRGELLKEIFSIQEEERRRIARELHDETSQSLASLAASLEAVAVMLPSGSEEVGSKIRKAEQVAIHALDEIHKIIYELRPSLLDDLGLVSAVRWMADNNLSSDGISVNFKTHGRAKRLDPKLEITLFRVIQEAVSNIARHAHARNVSLELFYREKVIEVKIKDDGIGFDVGEAISSKNRPRGLGLMGMKERLELLKGILTIKSVHNSGTEIDIEIPVIKGASDA